MPSMTVTSAAMRRLRCKLQSSRIALTGGIAKTSPATSPPSCECSPPQKPPRPSSTGSGSIGRGSKVRVRTSAGQLRTGERLVLVLDAVVFSATEGGYLVYNGNPLNTMRVARDEVKLMPPADAT